MIEEEARIEDSSKRYYLFSLKYKISILIMNPKIYQVRYKNQDHNIDEDGR